MCIHGCHIHYLYVHRNIPCVHVIRYEYARARHDFGGTMRVCEAMRFVEPICSMQTVLLYTARRRWPNDVKALFAKRTPREAGCATVQCAGFNIDEPPPPPPYATPSSACSAKPLNGIVLYCVILYRQRTRRAGDASSSGF